MLKKYNLDVNKHTFSDEGVSNFFWPLKIFSINNFRDDILKELIPLLKNKKNLDNDDPVKTSLNIMFKWFIIDILNIYKSLEIKKSFDKNNIQLEIPERFFILKKIINNESPPTIFEALKNGPKERFKKIKFLKKIYRFLQLNSFKDLMTLNFSKKVVISYHSFVAKNLRNNNEINFFKNFSDFYTKKIKDFPNSNISQISPNILEEIKKILNIIKTVFEKYDQEFTANIEKHFFEWIVHCNSFVNFHRKNIVTIPHNIYTGSSASEVWGKMLCNFTISSGGYVTNLEHGRGDILHEFLPKYFTDLDDVSEFITLNKSHSDINIKKYNANKQFALGEKNILINPPKKNIPNPFNLNHNQIFKKKSDYLTGMYISTCYLGYGGRLRPTLPDIVYYDFQIRPISDLKRLNKTIICKPHPEGRTTIKDEFYKKLNCVLTKKNYDEAIKKYDFDFFITDHVASTTMVDMMLSNKPTILMNFGTPQICGELKEDLKKSIYILDVEFSKENRAKYDIMKLEEIFFNIQKNSLDSQNKPIKKYYN